MWGSTVTVQCTHIRSMMCAHADIQADTAVCCSCILISVSDCQQQRPMKLNCGTDNAKAARYEFCKLRHRVTLFFKRRAYEVPTSSSLPLASRVHSRPDAPNAVLFLRLTVLAQDTSARWSTPACCAAANSTNQPCKMAVKTIIVALVLLAGLSMAGKQLSRCRSESPAQR